MKCNFDYEISLKILFRILYNCTLPLWFYVFNEKLFLISLSSLCKISYVLIHGGTYNMNFTCADCSSRACQYAQFDQMPSSEVCLTKQQDPEKLKAYYSPEDLEIAKFAAITEADGYGKQCRLEEIMAFAYRMKYHKLGIAFCVGFSREAKTLVEILRTNGFEVEAACCKCGSIPKEFAGVEPEHWLHPDRDFEIMCNPAGQAEILSEKGCNLCIVLGLCVGHDTLFIRHCKTPVTILGVKDRVMGHNPVAALYIADSYYSNRLKHFIENTFPGES